MTGDIPFCARLLSGLVPFADREAILGDLVEDAEFRSFRGLHRTIWMTAECAGIASGFAWARLRRAIVVPDAHELVVGFALEGRRAFHSPRLASAGLRALVFCGSIATLSFAAAVLVSALLSAAGF